MVKDLNATNMKAITSKTRNKGTAFSLGQVGTFTKVSTKKMKEMAMEK